MPLYEYQCSKCEKIFEVMQKFSDTPLTVHEGCGGAVQRILSASAFQFKGTGWYVTDYAKGTKSPASGGGAASEGSKDKADGAAEKPAGKATESKTESKPAPGKTKTD